MTFCTRCASSIKKEDNDMNRMKQAVRIKLSRKVCRLSLFPPFAAAMFPLMMIASMFLAPLSSAYAGTIIDEWGTIKAPLPPELKAVKIDGKTTALLVLDMVTQGCNNERRPRCIASVPKVQALLNTARSKEILVVHSTTGTTSVIDIVKDLAPRAQEPVVKSSVDKFYKTDLEKILAEKGIKTVIVMGTAAHGAVLYTTTGAALRGMKVILPVETMTAEDAYAEQYTAWHVMNAPANKGQVTLTRIDMIQF
jgi:nicotinamidase-related amidase